LINIDLNKLTPNEVFFHPDAGVITQSLGGLKELNIHVYSCKSSFSSFLIATDGLCGAFADGHLHKLYRGCEAPFFLSVISENSALMGAVDDRCGILLEMK